MMPSNYVDVLIIGGGWAGLTLARQLKREQPQLSIRVLEAKEGFSSKVGEATVEMTGHYFMKRLGLVNYLYRRHLPKNGLRFFFDTPEHDLALQQLSEHGTTSIPPHPAFQLDRARLEEDLTAMNREQGVDVLQGAKVSHWQLGEGQQPHQVTYQYQGEEQQQQARWVVDCSGRHRVARKQKKLHRQDNVPNNFAAWGRFKNIQDIDSLGTEEWRHKAFGRFLSTLHFTGDGYWIWVIPLSGGYTSIGVVGEQHKFDQWPKKQPEFLQFLQHHRALSELLEGAELVDFEAWGQLAYRADEFLFTQRWATSGFAAMFLDPLFSGGGDVIALLNDAISQQIVQDFNEPDRDLADQRLAEQVPQYNQMAKEFYQGLYAHIATVYPVLDCAELANALAAYNTAAYFVEIAWDYMAGHYRDLAYWQKKSFLRRGYMALELMLQRQVLSTRHALLEQGRYFDRNSEGFFESGADHYKYFVYQMGEQGRDGWRIDLRIKLFTEVFLRVTQAKLNLPQLAHRRVVQQCFSFVDILKAPLFDQADLPPLLAKLGEKLGEWVTEQLQQDIQVEVTQASFHSNQVNLLNADALDESMAKKAQTVANQLWQQTDEFIAMPSMVPVFLAFAREQADSIMDSTMDQRLVFDPTTGGQKHSHKDEHNVADEVSV
jgi:flavin-dependent dehydrogenase